MQLARAVTSGATLASLLQSVITAGCDCDGFLYGTLRSSFKQHCTDDSDAVLIEEREAAVTGFLCFSGTCSFYNSVGQVNMEDVESHLGARRSEMIGWFSYRRGASLGLTMREVAVIESLLNAQNGGSSAASDAGQESSSGARAGAGKTVSMLFAQLSTRPDHEGATITTQYRFFNCTKLPSSHNPIKISALELQTMNLGVALQGTQSYSDFRLLPEARSPLPVGSHIKGSDATATEALQAAAELARKQVSMLELHYEDQLSQVQKLCAELCTGSADLNLLMQRNNELVAMLT